MDVKTAAIQVLQKAGTALHAKDIAEQIMAANLWQSRGKTTDAARTIYNRHSNTAYARHSRWRSLNTKRMELRGE